MPDLSLSFVILQRRLLEQVRQRLSNGELTERRLARLTGISQPHMHNVLKGVRALTPEVADLLLGGLGLSALDLIAPAEAAALLEAHQHGRQQTGLAPVLAHPLGPGHPFPSFSEVKEWLRLPHAVWAGRRRLALTALAMDPESSVAPGHDFALLWLDEEARLRILPGRLYVLRWRGAAYLRRLRLEDGALVVQRQQTWLATDGPERIQLADQGLLPSVRAVVLWTGVDLRRASPLDYMGSFLENPASR